MRTIIEDALYTEQLHSVGDIKRLDDVLRGLLWALSKNAEEFPIVPGTKHLRIIKSDGYGGTPKLKIWFIIDTHLNEEHVHLLSIEPDELDPSQ